MTFSCFVYYRVSADHVPEASQAARTTITRMRSLTGVNARLMTKVDEPLLWMEIYEAVDDQAEFLSAMHECVEQSDLARWLEDDGQRHTEIFQTGIFECA